MSANAVVAGNIHFDCFIRLILFIRLLAVFIATFLVQEGDAAGRAVPNSWARVRSWRWTSSLVSLLPEGGILQRVASEVPIRNRTYPLTISPSLGGQQRRRARVSDQPLQSIPRLTSSKDRPLASACHSYVVDTCNLTSVSSGILDSVPTDRVYGDGRRSQHGTEGPKDRGRQLTARTGGAYSRGMALGRVIPTFFAVAMLLLRGGDCVSLLFADQESRDCCTRGTCSPAKKADPCCKSSGSAPVQHFQAENKSSVPPPSDAGLAIFDQSVPQVGSAQFTLSMVGLSFHSPPRGPSTQAPLPLLI